MPLLVHKSTAYWADSPSAVREHSSALSKLSTDVIASENTQSGQSRQDSDRRSTTIFSQFFFPAILKDSPRSMKFRLSRVSTSEPLNLLPKDRIKNIPPTLYDDPAFSPDPLSHPFFATSHDGVWASPPAVGHPSLKGRARRPPPPPLYPVYPVIADTEEFQLVQPPNSPMTPDDPASHASPPFPSSHINSSGSPPSTTPSSSVSSSTDSHLPPPIEISFESTESLHLPQEKKKNRISFLRRKPPPESPSLPAPVAAVVAEPAANRPNNNLAPPPSYEAIFTTRPSANRNLSAPETPRPLERPTLSQRSVTTAADSKPPPATTHRAIGRRLRAHELDRIDELDESNPLGLPVHHGGPYEAIQKLAQINPLKKGTPSNVGNQYQLSSHDPSDNRTRKQPSGRVQPPEATTTSHLLNGVSLNLTPGQILPHNFQGYYQPDLKRGVLHTPTSSEPYSGHQQMQPRFRIDSDMPYLRQQQQLRDPPLHPIRHDLSNSPPGDATRQQSNHHHSLPTDPLPPHSLPIEELVTPIRGHQSVPTEWLSSRSSSQSQSGQSIGVGLRQQDLQFVDMNSAIPKDRLPAQLPIDVGSDPASDRGPPNKEMPGGRDIDYPMHSQPLQHDAMSQSVHHQPRHPRWAPTESQTPGAFAAYPQLYRPTEPAHHGRRQLSEPSQFRRPYSANHGSIQEAKNTQYVSAEGQKFDHNTLQTSSLPQQQQQRPDRDTKSIQQSISSIASSSNSRTGGKVPQPYYLPKRLVMPTPLQSSQLMISRNQPPLPLPQSHHIGRPQSQQSQPRSPSALSSSSPVWGSNTNAQSGRAQETPRTQSRKLRKRTSINGPPPPASEQRPLANVSFSANVGYVETSSAASPPQFKAEKNPKKVLSKRRSGL